ncbi:MAG: methylmalonyl Co-A mutase-associated GTPase MeaB [Chitinophagaceae bacterium]|nr:methylmalonyl Co-A mutase-associated GTPase MeaB [Chitinophagaceae bacterium]
MDSNKTYLSKAITLIESTLASHQQPAQELIMRCLPFSGKSIRIGISGSPGVGKSTFIESFGKFLFGKNYKIAVLAIDPSSNRSKGSILGDKTRMEELSSLQNVFIRPSPSSGTLGGVARKTREAIILCEAAGFDLIIVETVGVGQSETAVHSLVDFFLLLLLPGAGDELQGIKRGIMEMADAILINKADGENIAKAQIALAEIRNALHFFRLKDSEWSPVAELCSAKDSTGIPEIWDVVCRYIDQSKSTGYFEKRRIEQYMQTLYKSIEEALMTNFLHSPGISDGLNQMEARIKAGEISSYQAANELLKLYSK